MGVINEEKIREFLTKAGAGADLSSSDFDKQFSDIGLDSLDVFNLLAEIEIEVGKKVSDEDFEEINTLNNVIEYMSR